jgi:hypothetical protein
MWYNDGNDRDGTPQGVGMTIRYMGGDDYDIDKYKDVNSSVAAKRELTNLLHIIHKTSPIAIDDALTAMDWHDV